MRVPYVLFVASTPQPSLGGGSVRARPILPVRVYGPAGDTLIDGFLDTASDDVILPAWVAPVIGIDLLPDHLVGRGSGKLLEHRPDASLFEIIEDCERRIILDMLEKCNWNQTDAAERFHVPLSTLNQKIKRLNIEIKKKGRE